MWCSTCEMAVCTYHVISHIVDSGSEMLLDSLTMMVPLLHLATHGRARNKQGLRYVKRTGNLKTFSVLLVRRPYAVIVAYLVCIVINTPTLFLWSRLRRNGRPALLRKWPN